MDEPVGPEKRHEYFYEYAEDENEEPYQKKQRVIEALRQNRFAYDFESPILSPSEAWQTFLIREGLIRHSDNLDPERKCWAHDKSDYGFNPTGYACMLCRSEVQARGWLICTCGACGPECVGRAIRSEIIEEAMQES